MVFIIFHIVKNDMSSYLYYLLGWLDNETNPTDFTKRQRSDVLKQIREKGKKLVDCRGLKMVVEDEIGAQTLSEFVEESPKRRRPRRSRPINFKVNPNF